MSKKPIEMLLVAEDDPGDLRLLSKMFNEPGLDNSKLTNVERMSEAEGSLAKHPVDIILLDLGLPMHKDWGRYGGSARPRPAFTWW
jgi:CheY-like chemotaxis protein